MSLNIKLDQKELVKLGNKLVKLNDKQLTNATRIALNKTVDRTQTNLIKILRLQRKLKAKDIRAQLTKQKAFGNNINKMQAFIRVTGKTISLLNFVKGNTEPKSQKGIAVKRRKGLKIEVRPGRTKIRKDVFIVKGHGNKNVLVRRQDNKLTKKKGDPTKQKGPLGGNEQTPGLARIVERTKIKTRLQQIMQKRLEHEWPKAVAFQLSKLK